jgi:hypothetical protein
VALLQAALPITAEDLLQEDSVLFHNDKHYTVGSLHEMQNVPVNKYPTVNYTDIVLEMNFPVAQK